jgi:hypothetical protein
VLTHVFEITTVFITIGAGLLGTLYYCLAVGFRNGDRPCDAQVNALLVMGKPPGAVSPGGSGPVIVVTVRNPSGTPVLAALHARRALLPALLTEPRDVSVPRKTSRRKFQPGKYETIGIVPAGGAAELAVPVAVWSRRYVLTAAVGQGGGRLRVHRLRLGPVSRSAEASHELFSSARQP